MAKWWREPLDTTRHRDHGWLGSSRHKRTAPADRLIPAWTYFVRVCGFTFEFATLDQLADCLAYYRRRLLPSSRDEVFEPEKGEWQPWYERLPLYLREEPKRVRVVKALAAALSEFDPGQAAVTEKTWPR